MNTKRVLFLLPLFAFAACDSAKRISDSGGGGGGQSLSCTGEIEYSTCSTSTGCTLPLSCSSLLSTNSQKKSAFKKALGKIFPLKATEETLEITTLTTNQAELLQSTAGEADSSWFNSSVSCSVDGDNVSCPNFLPISSDFTIVGTLNGEPITANVTVINDVTQATTADVLVGGCGQGGTTVQRMFDCSERVAFFAGAGAYGDPAVAFTPGTPDPNWFLVGCPEFTGTTVGTDTTVQQCAWLSPVIVDANPVVGINVNGSMVKDTTSPDLGPNGAIRLLWSGSLGNSDTYTFYEANGTNGSMLANCNGSGLCAQYNSGTPTYKFNDFIATNNGGGVSEPNLCTTQLAANDNSFSGMNTGTFEWIVPSYPMLMTLTGGSSCMSGTTSATCNDSGFSAISNSVPQFDQTGTNKAALWSSSVFDSDLGWLFSGDGGFGDVLNVDLDIDLGVRCVSAAW